MYRLIHVKTHGAEKEWTYGPTIRFARAWYLTMESTKQSIEANCYWRLLDREAPDEL